MSEGEEAEGKTWAHNSLRSLALNGEERAWGELM